ncbi:prephenate dehydrogenase [Tomitella fengzijianii]|uniref:prephenate dehydrogenase n=1 Tax=Tomitella fengzijianii TaxID=2597660 RepID=UPI0022A8A41C|nr:prephenate dehydrogenase [Tomitella fengzijianii]
MTTPSPAGTPPAVGPAAGPSDHAAGNPDRPDVCVLGLGLIGGSLLRAAVAAGRTVWGYNRSAESVREAEEAGYDVSGDLPAVLRRAAASQALLVIAVPLPAVDGVAAAIAEHAPHCPITDVVSVKRPMADALAAHGLDARYVGGHPMAGTAESGWSAGHGALFDGAVWVVAADDGADPEVWTQVACLAEDCGSVVVPAGSTEHDDAVARVSHLPHLLAEALAIAGADDQLALSLAAGSFRDGTRVAATDPLLVRAMCEGNADAVVTALDETLAVLAKARDALAAGDGIADLAGRGHVARREYEHTRRSRIEGLQPGVPGWIEQLRDAGRAGGVWARPLDEGHR